MHGSYNRTRLSTLTSSFTRDDLRTARRLLVVVAVIVGATAFLSFTFSFFSRKFYAPTGRAAWMWVEHLMKSGEPVVFFATRTFELPRNRTFVKIKIAADPQYTLYFNGREVGGARYDDYRTIDVYDVTKLAVEGQNRIVVATRSANGVGGFILAVDCSDLIQNFVVSDRSWRAYDSWAPELLRRDLAASSRPLQRLGAPPFGRWNYLPKRSVELRSSAVRAVPARGSSSFVARLPRIEVKSGVAVVTVQNVAAIAYDFGHIRGRARLTRGDDKREVVKVRFANAPDEFQHEAPTESVVFAEGERAVTDADDRQFRYLLVYGSDARPDVVVSAE